MDKNKPTAPTPNQAIPMPAPKYNWRGDASVTSKGSPTGASPTFFGLSQSPNSAGMPQIPAKRRDSLKNMVHLNDFATP